MRAARPIIAAIVFAFACACPASACFQQAHAIATQDLLRLPPVEQFYAVYLWCGDVPLKDRPRFILTLAGNCNALSREPTFYFPQLVAQDMSLVRINYSAYGWPLKVVQDLIKAHPYSTSELKVLNVPWHGGVWPGDGQEYAAGSFKYNRVVPLLGARWFLWQTMAQKGRTPGYFDFLELKTRADFDKLVGFDRKLADGARRRDKIDAIVYSGVSSQPRNILIQPVLEGRRYGTEDSEFAVKEKNALRIVDREFFKHEAEEWIGSLSNGFLTFFLSAADGTRQDVAPPFLSDDTSPSRDKQIHPSVSCLRCHYRTAQHGSAGLIDPLPHFRTVLSEFQLLSPDYKRLKEFEALYLRPFHNQVVIDRLTHNAAVIEATGMPADIWALAATTAFEQYDAGANLDEAAAFFGCDKLAAGKLVQAAIQEYATKTGLLDPVLVLFARGKTIPRVQYHEVFPVLHATWEGTKNHAAAIVDPKLLVPPADADGRKLKPLLPKLPKLQLLPAGAGLQQLSDHLSAVCRAALQHRLRAADGGDLRVGRLSAGHHYDSDCRGDDGDPEQRAGIARGGSRHAAAAISGEQVRPAAGSGGEAGRDRWRTSVAAATAAHRNLEAALRGVPHWRLCQGQLADVRRERSVHAAAEHDGGDHLPHQHERSETAHASERVIAV